MKAVQRIGIRRTQAVDDLLKGIWKLRPELERKNTTTILLGLESFFRECKANAEAGHSPSAVIDSTSSEETTAAASEPITGTSNDVTVSDDIEW